MRQAPLGRGASFSLFPSLLLSSLELSDTKFYETFIRALLGTASQFCEVVVLTGAIHPERPTAIKRFGTQISSGVVFRLNTIRLTKITTHRF